MTMGMVVFISVVLAIFVTLPPGCEWIKNQWFSAAMFGVLVWVAWRAYLYEHGVRKPWLPWVWLVHFCFWVRWQLEQRRLQRNNQWGIRGTMPPNSPCDPYDYFNAPGGSTQGQGGQNDDESGNPDQCDVR